MSVTPTSFALRGGQDLVTPFLEARPGSVIDALNFECLPKGGYQRIAGYSAYDGTDPKVTGLPCIAVPGSGPVRSVFTINGTVYAIRDNASATTGVLYRADSLLRWQVVPLGSYIRYNMASALFPSNTVFTINGATSGATATVRKTVFSGGFTDQSTGFGLLVVTGVTGTFISGENLRIGTTVYAKASSALTAVTIPVGGVYSVVTENFYGGLATRAAYLANGIGLAAEFDGTTFTPIDHGLTIFPSRVVAHKSHLILAYREGALFNSAIGDPLSYSVLAGSAEIDVGDEVTELQSLSGGVLMIGCRNKVDLLYGNDASTWNRQPYAQHGIISNTVSEVANQTVLLDTRGVQRLSTSQAYGDFESSSLSYLVNEQLLTYLSSGAQPFSCVSQNNSQYRLFWGTQGYYFTFDGGAPGVQGDNGAQAGQCVGVMPVSFAHSVSCMWEGLTAAGNELLLFGTADGYAMRMDQTNFFNGAPIVSRLQLPFGYFGTPTRRKQFKRAVFDCRAVGETATIMGRQLFDLGNGNSNIYDGVTVKPGNNGLWSSTAAWNAFQWASPSYTTAVLDLEGLGENLSIIIQHAGTEDVRIAIYGVTIHYALRRLSR